MDTNNIFINTVKASKEISLLSNEKVEEVLNKLSEAILENEELILDANKKDLSEMEKSNPLYDRLLLTKERIASIASDMKKVASLKSPVGELLSSYTRPNGMVINKVRIPFGVIGIIYEARPNVTLDVFSLCFKTLNAVILKGGSDAEHSNTAIVSIIKNVLKSNGVNPDIISLLSNNREDTLKLLKAKEFVDLIIPRGSSSLINFVRNNSIVPVIETGAGVCHAYFDIEGDLKKGKDIILNAKTRRVSVCNALDTLIIHKNRLCDLPALCSALSGKNVNIFADKDSFDALSGNYPPKMLKKATESDFGTEFLDYKMSVKTVNSIYDAIEHISNFSSKHSECIITENMDSADIFTKKVDSACVYVNVSTAFTDGGEFGFGSEIGISTQKLHARGPMALAEITTYKYIISGNGQIRTN